MTQTVFLTGVSGYIGLHTAKLLLEAGYAVRGSVRNASKGQQVRDTLKSASVDTSNLTIVELDLGRDIGWGDALRGVDYLVHMASPFAVANPKNEDEMIKPAVDGTLRALRAAKAAGVKRVVLTSSLLSVLGSMKTGTATASDWTDVNARDVSTYTKSKTLAERAAWDFVENLTGEDRFELVVINPGAVYGPPLGNDLSGTSMGMIDKMLRGKVPMVPKLAMPMVDVRDVALLHLCALTEPAVAGERIIASDTAPRGFAEIAQILKDEGYSGPSTKIAPNFMIRLTSLFDRETKGMLGYLGMNLSADNTQTRQIFDWSPIPFKDTIVDTGRAIKAAQR